MSIIKSIETPITPGGNASGYPVVAIITLGCKVNYTDTEEIASILTLRGYRVIYGHHPADLSIINSCTVTSKADYQSRQATRRAIRDSGGAQVLVTGCAVEIDPDRIREWGQVSAIVPIKKRDKVGDIVESLIGPAEGVLTSEPERKRTRAFLKIQEGCDAFCTYCIVPRTRGREESLGPDEVILQVERLARRGFKEIVLTGIHLGRYGGVCEERDENSVNLASLLRKIDECNFPLRIRLSSIEPMELNDDLISIIAKSDTIAPHLHIPLQSGDDSILKAMGRPYDANSFVEVVTKAHKELHNPKLRAPVGDGPGLGIDVMVGFPGEGEREFQNTLKIIKSLPATYLHVFPYSRRPGTPASRMGGEVPGNIKKGRAKMIREIGEEKKREYIYRNIGSELKVLTETFSDDGNNLLLGKSENYLNVYLTGRYDEINCFIKVRVKKPFRDGVYGERLD